MKLRIKGNSIRLRLGQSEVRRLANDGIVEESITFGGGRAHRLSYVLCTGPNHLAVTAEYEEGRINVRMPTALARDWAGSDRVGIEAVQVAGDGNELKILIEKDFKCIDAPPDESREDAFPHPERGCAASRRD
jgi:hypothetical protein